MSSSQNSKTSRWGSLLQQAVAGVESRLDTILTDSGDDLPPKTKAPPPERNTSQRRRKDTLSSASPARKADGETSRTRSDSRASDRLQERLARAVNGAENGRSSQSISRTASPATTASASVTNADTSLAGTESTEEFQQLRHRRDGTLAGAEADGNTGQRGGTHEATQNVKEGGLPPDVATRVSSSSELAATSTGGSQNEKYRVSEEVENMNGRETPVESSQKAKSTEEYEALLAQLRSDYEVSEIRRQEEVHAYSERIDALQSKLHYLTTEIVENAQHRISSSPAGGLERKVAQQEEKIALLLKEGEQLSATELRHTTIIKKLRTRITQDDKDLTEAHRKLDRSEKLNSELKQKLKRAESAEKAAKDKLRMTSKLEKEVETLRAENDSKDTRISLLRAELAQVKERVDEDEQKQQGAALETERMIAAELREELSNVKLEHELAQTRAATEIGELKTAVQREKERVKATEAELRREQALSETKVEALRARAEEAAMGPSGDGQAKLIRQFETLQTQYAVSSENWQRIEESLMARVTSLEKERDELSKKENDVRQKARKLNLQAKQAEQTAQESISKLQSVEQELVQQNANLESMKLKVEQLEDALKDAQLNFEKSKEGWEVELTGRIEQEKAKWQEEVASERKSGSGTGNQSPSATQRKDNPVDLHMSQPQRNRGQMVLPELQPPHLYLSSSRRPSFQPPRTPDAGAMSRQGSFASIPPTPLYMPETPPARITEPNDFGESQSSPQQTVNDMISVATTGAGPSVQLVERMSAAVRRLNSEKAATRDELLRLSTQRDEAREEVVSLMRELEQKRSAEERIKSLETELATLDERYQASLELLGEKSELVEELRADLADIKHIYRDVLDHTMK
ncbi:MAG: hypothetical protein M1823_005013 [Watsoniomyces obsoletus]|nr:MAG: hypothetical protein M1823_005013 [Watsoniomyces obsoletus]